MMMKTRLTYFAIGLFALAISIGACDEEDGGVDGPPWSCHYDQEMTGSGAKGCFEYDLSVTEEDAREACAVHKIGAQLNMAENRRLRGGPCDLEKVSGFCTCPCYVLPGREYLQYKELYIDDPARDCVVDPANPGEINSLYGCENNVGGTYTCTVDGEISDGGTSI